ncbi:MAG TPA: Ig-like domain-containing protein, partial [Thermodesulfovibrionales bacterium]|nr:Ig-like domain-containing protein [Thermodesulfovibrionales bacterium]
QGSAPTTTITASHPFDVAGIQVKVKEATIDKPKYAPSDTIALTLKIESNTTMPATLKVWIVDPEKNYTQAGEQGINLSSFENLLVTHNSSLVTVFSGIHRLVYGIYSGDLLLVSGSVAFDVGEAVLSGLTTDKTDYSGSETVIARPTMFGTVSASLELQIDGVTVQTQSVFLNGFMTLNIPLTGIQSGNHVLKGILTSGGLNSIRETSFIFKKDIEPPVTTAPIGVPAYQNGDSMFTSGTTPVTLTATDTGDGASGVSYTEYRIDAETSWTRYSDSFNLAGYAEGTHTIYYRSVDNAGNIETEKTRIVIVDNTPPAGSITINDNATYSNTSSVTLSLSASDGAGSGVTKMCLSNTDSCNSWEDYTGTKLWTLPSGDGGKTIYVWYQDHLGNADTSPYSSSIILDATRPILTVSTLSDGSWTSNDLLNVAGQATDNTGIQQLTINSAAIAANPDGTFSLPVTLQDGPNTVAVDATDLAGNQTADSRTIYLDRLAPTITLLTPADNTKTNQSPIDVTGTVDESSSVTVRMNSSDPVAASMSGSAFSLPVIPFYGINTIEVTATDPATNTSTVKRTVTFDDLSPSLSVTEPAQDIKTNKADMIIKGETTDMTVVAVTITIEGNVYTPVLTEGRFEQPVTFTEQKIYQIYVTAVDEAGNETTVQRNIVYDTTAPIVTLDPVTSPTPLNSQTLTGTVEAWALVSVTCPTATVGEVTYPTATTWAVTLSHMQQGNNTITINATDEAGNTSRSISTTITVFTLLPAGSFVIGDGNAAIGSSVTFWDSQWWKNNTLIDGAAPSSFKGFANVMSSIPPNCGGTWTATSGNSTTPPSGVPAYMAVLVSSNITKSGSAISGNIKKIVIVKTNAGYQPAPGYPGTATVVGVLCQ